MFKSNQINKQNTGVNIVIRRLLIMNDETKKWIDLPGCVSAFPIATAASVSRRLKRVKTETETETNTNRNIFRFL